MLKDLSIFKEGVMIRFKEFLERHHGLINRFFLSYDGTKIKDTSKLTEDEYKRWFNKVNRNIKVDMDLMHSNQSLDDFEELKPYYKLRIKVGI